MIVAPSILSADFSKLGEEIKNVDKAGADWIHIDVMDGCFVPNITIGPLVVKSIRHITKKPFDVHLMINHPEHYVKDFADAGADYITVHCEATNHLHRLIYRIKELGKKAGVSLNPATPVSVLEEIIPSSIEKIKKLAKMKESANSDLIIHVDGGVSDKNIKELKNAGCNAVVAGSYVFKANDYKVNISNLKV